MSCQIRSASPADLAPLAATLRSASPADLAPVAATLRSAGLGANVGRLLEFPHRSPTGDVLAAEDRGEIIRGGAVAGFGVTGWIGALGVSGGARRRGVGTALTEAAVGWLREHGAQTVLLYATEAGRPVYRPLRFSDGGAARARSAA